MNNQPEQKLTPEQALNILDQAAGQAALIRREHVLVQEAIQLLSALIAEIKKETKDGYKD